MWDRKSTFIIAEILTNHGNDFNKEVTLVKKAKECGANAVKFQAYVLKEITLNVNNKYFKIKHPQWED